MKLSSDHQMKHFNVLPWLLAAFMLGALFVCDIVWQYYDNRITIGTGTAGNPEAKWTVQEWGTFGDFFSGTLGPILSFFGLMAILLTLAMQAHALKESTNSFKRQSFDNSFFSLVNFHNAIVNDMKYSTGTSVYQGRAVFRKLFTTIYLLNSSQEGAEKDKIIAAYEYFLQSHEYIVGHYFRNLYRIYKYIDESDAFQNEEDKRNYSGIIRAQLSTYELALLYFNSLHPNGHPFKGYIEKYAIFENFRYMHMEERMNFRAGLYEESAWGTPK